jgi:uncharacterized protein YndB with AHSA1/START domain
MAKIHQEVVFKASPAQIYRALTDSSEHARFTGAPAEVSPHEGGTFACHGGYVLGRNLSLVPDRRIVLAWRGKDWAADVYSIARFELTREGEQTRLVFDQDAVPDEHVDHIDSGWKRKYWEPLRAYLES